MHIIRKEWKRIKKREQYMIIFVNNKSKKTSNSQDNDRDNVKTLGTQAI